MTIALPVWSFYRVEEPDFPYGCLLAGKCPSLQGRKLCEYLNHMDQSEREIIKTELQQYETIDRKHFYKTVLSIVSIALTVILGVVALVFRSVIPLYPASVLLYAAIAIVIPAISDVNEISGELSEERLLRLQAKIEDIEREIQKPSKNAEEVEQLNLAKYYFQIQF